MNTGGLSKRVRELEGSRSQTLRCIQAREGEDAMTAEARYRSEVQDAPRTVVVLFPHDVAL
jgi:hypothetical protein